ncbi:MAG TPA: hypothetical protein VIK35_04520 [Verrucomicrobiae bacterium]
MKTNSNSKCKILLCLALPLTVAAGHASDSSRSLDTTTFIDSPAPLVATVSAQQSADSAINREIFHMVLADRDLSYDLHATVKDGLVTLDVASSDVTERQRVVNEIWELHGVNQVKNELGVNMPSTETPVVVR